MTETETRTHQVGKRQNGGAMAETSTVEDVFDDTYEEKEGPKPPRMLVWRNIIWMTLLHVGALYGLTLLPSASLPTLAWSKYLVDREAGVALQLLLVFFFFPASRPQSEDRMC